jgi:hypothetical protein
MLSLARPESLYRSTTNMRQTIPTLLPQHSQDIVLNPDRLKQARTSIWSKYLPARPARPPRPSRPSGPSCLRTCLHPSARMITLILLVLIIMIGAIVGAIAVGHVIQAQYFRESRGVISPSPASTLMQRSVQSRMNTIAQH